MKYYWLLGIFLLFSCKSDDDIDSISLEDNNSEYTPLEEDLVSELSIKAFTADKAFGRAIPNLSELEISFFGVGNAMFNQNWVSAPASTTSRDGLGPLFNARACSTCHLRDGRGKPLENDKISQGFLMRLSSGNNIITGPIKVPNYGGQLQDNANFNFDKEGSIKVVFETITGMYADGSTYQLRKPIYSFTNLNYGEIGTPKQSPRVGQQVIGLGFLDALSEKSILANADENDIDNDGISGRANYVWNVKQKKVSVGKFGWKANQPSLSQQIAGAFSGDMGLTSSIFPKENCPHGIDCTNLANGNNIGESVEVPNAQFNRIEIYMAAISVPKRRNSTNLDVVEGKRLFNELTCIKCHVDNFTTSKSLILSQLNNINIKPYSDLLLHDMGEGLADNSPDFLANGNEWRTQPLWGIGLIKLVNKHTFLLHDGRARNIEEAILWHGGEAQKAQTNFINLNRIKRNQLIAFLNTL